MKTDRKKVLVVDDEVKILDVIKSFLESKDYIVFTAENGKQADDYLTKPFRLKELHARMEAILRRSSGDLVPLCRKMTFQEGDLEVDLESRSIRKGGKEVNLTPNEFKILYSLIKLISNAVKYTPWRAD